MIAVLNATVVLMALNFEKGLLVMIEILFSIIQLFWPRT
jgi:hypothetical protein